MAYFLCIPMKYILSRFFFIRNVNVKYFVRYMFQKDKRNHSSLNMQFKFKRHKIRKKNLHTNHGRNSLKITQLTQKKIDLIMKISCYFHLTVFISF